jgi:AraC-like DNA-binding protein
MIDSNGVSMPNSTRDFSVKNVSRDNYLILFTAGYNAIFKNDNVKANVGERNIVFIERGVSVSCRIREMRDSVMPYRIIEMNREELVKLRNILYAVYQPVLDDKQLYKRAKHRVIRQDVNVEIEKIFDSILSEVNCNIRILKVAYLISIMESRDELMMSIYASTVMTFADKVRELLEADLSKKWRLSMVADVFNISEIAVRKRLEGENISFNKILVDARMSKALMLLLDGNCSLTQIAQYVGISSSSYLSNMFKYKFGVTPRQMLSYLRCDR